MLGAPLLMRWGPIALHRADRNACRELRMSPAGLHSHRPLLKEACIVADAYKSLTSKKEKAYLATKQAKCPSTSQWNIVIWQKCNSIKDYCRTRRYGRNTHSSRKGESGGASPSCTTHTARPMTHDIISNSMKILLDVALSRTCTAPTLATAADMQPQCNPQDNREAVLLFLILRGFQAYAMEERRTIPTPWHARWVQFETFVVFCRVVDAGTQARRLW